MKSLSYLKASVTDKLGTNHKILLIEDPDDGTVPSGVPVNNVGSGSITDPSQPGQAAYAAKTGEAIAYALAQAGQAGSRYSYNAFTIGLKQGANNAAENSDIWEAFIAQNDGQSNRCVFFPSGGWYFARPVNFGGLASVYGEGIPTYTKAPTRLYANAAADGAAAFTAVSTSLVNISLQGNHKTGCYSLTGSGEDRKNLLTDRDAVFVEMWDGIKDVGLKTDGTAKHQNVLIRNYYIGVYALTGSAALESCEIALCHTAAIITNDCYVHNLKVRQSMIGVETLGSTAVITNLRGDSIGSHLIQCLAGGVDVNGVNADFCLGSIIHFGGAPTLDGVTPYSKRAIGHIADIKGRAAVYSAYGKTEAYTMQGKEPDKCSLISFEPGTVWNGGIFETNYAQPSNPMDFSSTLFCPAAEICIPEGTKLVGARLRAMSLSWAGTDAAAIQREHIRMDSPGSLVFVESSFGSWAVYRDSDGFHAEGAGQIPAAQTLQLLSLNHDTE